MKVIPKFLNKSPVLFAISFWVLIVFLIVAIINWVFMPVIAGRFVETLPVPDVVGLSADEAESTLQKAGLNVKWAAEGRYSGEVPANHVLTQMPVANRTVKENRTVLLTVSKGRQEVSVPDLRGSSQRQAEITLQRLELLLGSKIEGAHASMPIGTVIRTEPAAGTKVRTGTKVDIVVSARNSSGKVLLPNLIDLSVDKAKEIIDSLGFNLGNLTYIQAENKLPNTVLTINPKSGEYLEKGTEINITVAE